MIKNQNPESYEAIYKKIDQYINNTEEYNLPEARVHCDTPLPIPADQEKIGLRDKIDTSLTGLAVGLLVYEATTPLPEGSARITLGVFYGLGAAAFRGYVMPRVETALKQKRFSQTK